MTTVPELERNVRQLDGDVRSIYELLGNINATLERHDKRFDTIDGRLASNDRRFDAIDGRLDTIDGRFDTIESLLRAALS